MVGRGLCLLLTVAIFLIVVTGGERARNDHRQEDEQDFVDDERDHVIETIKRFLLSKKTTTVKPSSGAISALITTTKANKYDTTKSSITSRFGTTPTNKYDSTKSSFTSRFGSTTSAIRPDRTRATVAPTKEACGVINPCQNGGTCKTLSSGRFYCFCSQDYYGKNCENKFISSGTANRDRAATDHCAKSPCRNGGECVGLRTTYYCRCKSPYYGTACDKRINKREEMIDEQSNSPEENIEAYERDLEEDREDLRQALANENMK